MTDAILLVDIGSTFTKVCAVDVANLKILGSSRAFTTVDSDINIGLTTAMEYLENQIGKLNVVKRLACSSAAGGLKMVAIGLVTELTAKAAKLATLSAGAKLLKTYSYTLNQAELKEIEELKPEIILLCGGTDGGNSETIISNAKALAALKLKAPIVAAGNKSAADEVKQILVKSGKEVIVADNVMSEFSVLNITSAQAAIREVFLRHIIKAKGITKFSSLVEGIIMPTPSAVLQAATLLSIGTEKTNGLGDLVVVDIGGATTDIYSICSGAPSSPNVVVKGLNEPFAKRTVEGDLGARYSAKNVVECFGPGNFAKTFNLTEDNVHFCLKEIEKDYSVLAKTKLMQTFDNAIASSCAKLGVKRHSGTMEISYGPMGAVYVQTGKNLSDVKYIIGTGGPITNNNHYKEILQSACGKDPVSLIPSAPQIGLDKKYLLASMGLLSEHYPNEALQIMKKEMEWC